MGVLSGCHSGNRPAARELIGVAALPALSQGVKVVYLQQVSALWGPESSKPGWRVRGGHLPKSAPMRRPAPKGRRERAVMHAGLLYRSREVSAGFPFGSHRQLAGSRFRQGQAKRSAGVSDTSEGRQSGPTGGGTNRRLSVVSAFDSCGLLGGRTELPVVITYGKV